MMPAFTVIATPLWAASIGIAVELLTSTTFLRAFARTIVDWYFDGRMRHIGG